MDQQIHISIIKEEPKESTGESIIHIKIERDSINETPAIHTTSLGSVSKISKITDINNSSKEDEINKYIIANDEFIATTMKEHLISDKETSKSCLKRFYNKSNTVQSNSMVIDLTTTDTDVDEYENLTNEVMNEVTVTGRVKVNQANVSKDLVKAEISDQIRTDIKANDEFIEKEEDLVSDKAKSQTLLRRFYDKSNTESNSMVFDLTTTEKDVTKHENLTNEVTDRAKVEANVCKDLLKAKTSDDVSSEMKAESHLDLWTNKDNMNACNNEVVTEDRNNLSVHFNKYTDEMPYACAFCDYKCKKKAQLVNHVRIHTGEKPYSCSVCSYRCSHRQSLINHRRMHTGEKPYTCSICQSKFQQRNTLTTHMSTHTDQKTFACQFCGFKCRLRSLHNHEACCSKRFFACDYCGYKCAFKPNLVSHIRTHTGDKPYSCSICHLKCEQKTALERHLRTHTGEKSFSCEFCDFKCNRRSSLSNHMLAHTRGKPFSCSICNYRSSYKRHLDKHMQTHTGDDPYSCSICHLKCRQKTDLERHLRTHSGEKPFSCEFCDCKFGRRYSLGKHMLTHTGGKPFPCSICNYRSSYKHYLDKHMQTHNQ